MTENKIKYSRWPEGDKETLAKLIQDGAPVAICIKKLSHRDASAVRMMYYKMRSPNPPKSSRRPVRGVRGFTIDLNEKEYAFIEKESTRLGQSKAHILRTALNQYRKRIHAENKQTIDNV